MTLFSDNLAILKLNQASLSEQLHILQNFERDFRTCEFKFASILIKHLPRATKKVEGPYKRITVQPELEIYYRKMAKRYNSDHHKKGTAKRVRLDLHTKYVLKKPLLRECAPYLTPEQYLILEAWTEAYKQNKAGGVPSKIVLIEKCKTRFESGKIALIRPALIETIQEARPSVPKRSTSMKKTHAKHQRAQPKKTQHPITVHLVTGVSSGTIKDDSVEVF